MGSYLNVLGRAIADRYRLEEESSEDRDYYLSADTINMLEEGGAASQLVSLLRAALTGRDGLDVCWSRS